VIAENVQTDVLQNGRGAFYQSRPKAAEMLRAEIANSKVLCIARRNPKAFPASDSYWTSCGVQLHTPLRAVIVWFVIFKIA
jgi:hypothetical protein